VNGWLVVFSGLHGIAQAIPALTLTQCLMLLAGVLVGIYGVVFGGSMFVSVPIFVALVPGCPPAQYVGSLKLGSLLRSIGSTISTWRSIDWVYCLAMAWPFVAGTVLGASFLNKAASATFLIPLMIIAVVVCEFSEKISKLAFWSDRDFFFIASFAIGIYAGYWGIGMSFLLVALLRVNNPKDEDIFWVKIQARFIETTTVVAAVSTHLINGNIKLMLVFYWAIGTIVGGALGGWIMNRYKDITPRTQIWVLRASYLMGVVGVGYLTLAPRGHVSSVLFGG